MNGVCSGKLVRTFERKVTGKVLDLSEHLAGSKGSFRPVYFAVLKAVDRLVSKSLRFTQAKFNTTFQCV